MHRGETSPERTARERFRNRKCNIHPDSKMRPNFQSSSLRLKSCEDTEFQRFNPSCIKLEQWEVIEDFNALETEKDNVYSARNTNSSPASIKESNMHKDLCVTHTLMPDSPPNQLWRFPSLSVVLRRGRLLRRKAVCWAGCGWAQVTLILEQTTGI